MEPEIKLQLRCTRPNTHAAPVRGDGQTEASIYDDHVQELEPRWPLAIAFGPDLVWVFGLMTTHSSALPSPLVVRNDRNGEVSLCWQRGGESGNI